MAELGRQAMAGTSLDDLRLEACRLVVEVVGVDPDLVAQVLSGRTPVPPDLLAEDRDFVFSALQVLDSQAARARAERESWHLAMHDSLTGLANRTLFAERMSDALVELRPGRDHISLISLDLDGFKRVNDSLGHAKGDDLLRDVAVRIIDAVRPSDVVARLGGDEFAVLLTSLAHPAEADTVAARILTALQAPFSVSGHAVHLSASIGITSAASRAIDADELLADADLAMYAAKAAGRGRAVCFSPKLRKAAVGQLALEEDLRYASTRGLFRLDYQPVVDLETGRFIGGEALIRWPHPTRGLVTPLDFIPLAEDTGLVVPLGAWVLDQACAQLAQWQPLVPRSAEFSVGINVSARQIIEPGFAEAVGAALTRADVDPHRIVLEMTESVFMADDTASMRILSGLREMGIRIAIDDFGTGYSSLAYLRRVPLDILKVDRSFVTNLASNRQDRAITGAVVELARQLDLFVIAEGIETAEQLEALVDLGCTAGQGFLMHRPMAPEAFTDALMGRLPLGDAAGSAAT